MKGIIIFLIILAILAGIGFWIGKKAWDKIHFVFTFKGVDLGGLNINDLSNVGQTSAKINVALRIINDNNFSIPFSNVRTTLYYDDVIIAHTTEELAARKFRVLSNGYKIVDEVTGEKMDEIQDSVNVYFNVEAVHLIRDIVQKKNPSIRYEIRGSIFGLPITYTDSFRAQA